MGNKRKGRGHRKGNPRPLQSRDADPADAIIQRYTKLADQLLNSDTVAADDTSESEPSESTG